MAVWRIRTIGWTFCDACAEGVETLKGIDHRGSIEAALAFQASERDDALHLRRPPDDDVRIALILRHHGDARRLGDEHRDDRGTDPFPPGPRRLEVSESSLVRLIMAIR